MSLQQALPKSNIPDGIEVAEIMQTHSEAVRMIYIKKRDFTGHTIYPTTVRAPRRASGVPWALKSASNTAKIGGEICKAYCLI
jgi:hypothetical protein